MKYSYNSPKVSIIILNWNNWKDTIECLESLYQINYPNYDVILVDNHSQDNSIKKIEEYCKGKIKVESSLFKYKAINKPIKVVEYKDIVYNKQNKYKKLPPTKKLILIKNNKNYGFAEGNNIGIKFILKYLNSDYILLLNNDTIVDQHFLDEMIKAGKFDDNIGILGPTIYYYNNKIKIQSAGVKLDPKLANQKLLGLNELDNGQFKEISSVDYVSGCALLAKREIFNKIGFLDIDYFLYWEEVDWCFRANKAGYQIIHVPSAKIWHKGSVAGTSNDKIYYSTRNMFWFMRKNAKKNHYILFLLYFFLLKFWFQIGVYLLYYKNIKGIYPLVNGTINGLRPY